MRLDTNQLARLKIECPIWCRLPFRDRSSFTRNPCAAPQAIKPVVEPTHRTSYADPKVANPEIKEISRATNDLPQAHVSRRVILDILAEIPPIKPRRRVRKLCGLAYVSRIFRA